MQYSILIQYHSNALVLFVLREYWVECCISFIPSTILQLSCILRFSLSLMSPPQHWALQIAIDRIAESGKTCINSPPWPSFISLITNWIQYRILGTQRLVADSIGWEFLRVIECGENGRTTVCLNILLQLHWQQRFRGTYLLNWYPSGTLYWIVLYFGCQIRFILNYYPLFQVESENIEKCIRAPADDSDTEVNKYSNVFMPKYLWIQPSKSPAELLSRQRS